ncbi:helix-turn-helix transcriptional regulator [Nocardia arthritidis]|uniref:Helix-turn-helix domain-containing protein n=1 Tax=Nocardia arthritidis TaxID=228602 RepID=A0A6G9Y9Z9_9NOCA|nr:AraC family transcriptional regulator [Nocardia arthritidis]QIS09984.1 helix-turn-helix domain-containing protein [Nocardia arthritidis]
MTEMSRLVRHERGIPVFDYRTDPVTPPVSVLRMHRPGRPGPDGRHIHDFPVLFYTAGIVHVVAPGRVIDLPVEHGLGCGTVVAFDPRALGGAARPAWASHPLLYPFLHGSSDGLLRLSVPDGRDVFWENTISAIEAEIAGRREGYRQAALAYLTLLLIELARMAADVVGDLRRSGEPLLAAVFEAIDDHIGEPLSLRDVARAVGMTPGHLTTVVRRRTGRTVQDWIVERRMTEARRLLTETELPIGEIARRVGMADPGYFTRVFRRENGAPPRRWRERSAAR